MLLLLAMLLLVFTVLKLTIMYCITYAQIAELPIFDFLFCTLA